ncbi:MAG: bifunctional 3-(3-hydroxy-phenyl)propionate/3-hydroxycinnamic acid hydroxylase [Chloroflexota bacterium]
MFDIAIVGYGPVGATLANLLGQDGWKVAVLEATKEIFPIPRAVHIDDEAQRIFQAAGLFHLVEPSFGGYPPDRQYINARGKVFFETHLNRDKPYGYQSNMYFHQPTLEAGLREGAGRFERVQIFLNRSVTGLTHEEHSVTIQAQDPDSGSTITVEARYVVGCDGARSFVRKFLGIQLRDLNFEQPWLVTDFYLKPGLERGDLGLPYAHQQFCNPEQPISFIPNGSKGHYRLEFMLPKGVTKETAEQEAYVHKMLARMVDLEKIEIVRGTVYTFHSLIAQRWRVQNVLIAGDAAHQMPPFAGQGMCSGLRDVHNLSWKLSMVLRGEADAALLDSYERERRPHVTRMTRGTMFLGNLVQTQNPIRGLVRDWLFQTLFKLPALFGRIAHFALRAPKLKTDLRGGAIAAVVGTYFIQPKVTTAEGEILLLDELLGPNFAVLGKGIDPSPYFTKLTEQLPIRCIKIEYTGGASTKRDREAAAVDSPVGSTPGSSTYSGTHSSQKTVQIEDHTGKLMAWFEENSAEFVVLRPDRFVFGAYSVENIATSTTELSNRLMLTKPKLSRKSS